MNFTIRPARIDDASAIALVQVESWRTTYAGIVPDDYLASLNVELRAQSWREHLQAGAALLLVAEDDWGMAFGPWPQSIGSFNYQLTNLQGYQLTKLPTYQIAS